MGIILQILGPIWANTLGILAVLGFLFGILAVSIPNYSARFGKKTIWITVGFVSGFLLATVICVLSVPGALN